MNELTLYWLENKDLRTQTIREGQSSKTSGTIRIGRDPELCDIVLSDSTVSDLQAEIFFDREQGSFYLRCLSESNAIVFDGERLETDEVAIAKGSSLQFGQTEMKVTAMRIKQSPQVGEETQPKEATPQEPVEPKKILDIAPVYTLPTQEEEIPAKPEVYARTSYYRDKQGTHSSVLLIGLGIATVVSLVAGEGWQRSQLEAKNLKPKATPTLTPSGQSNLSPKDTTAKGSAQPGFSNSSIPDPKKADAIAAEQQLKLEVENKQKLEAELARQLKTEIEDKLKAEKQRQALGKQIGLLEPEKQQQQDAEIKNLVEAELQRQAQAKKQQQLEAELKQLQEAALKDRPSAPSQAPSPTAQPVLPIEPLTQLELPTPQQPEIKEEAKLLEPTQQPEVTQPANSAESQQQQLEKGSKSTYSPWLPGKEPPSQLGESPWLPGKEPASQLGESPWLPGKGPQAPTEVKQQEQSGKGQAN